MTVPPLLELRGLGVTFSDGPAAVRGLDLTVDEGEVLALIGASGSGKSVTAAAVVGLLPRSAQVTGSVRFAGDELLGRTDRELEAVRGRRIGSVFQDPSTALDPSIRIGRQLVEVARHHRELTRGEAVELAASWLDRVGLPDPEGALDAYPHELSGGMRQRVLIALACLPGPDLLLADEPTTALDPVIQKQVLELLGSLRSELGLAVLLITHDFGVVSALADRVAVLDDGTRVEQGTVEEVLAAPASPVTRRLVDAVPVLGSPDRSPRPSAVARAAPSDTGAPLLALEGVSHRFRTRDRTPALDAVGLEIAEGSSVGLIGASGSGKSTLARVVAGLVTPDAGRVRYRGRDVTGARRRRDARRELQLVFQDHGTALNPRVRVEAALTRPQTRLGVVPSDGRRARDRAVELLETVGLGAEHLDRYPHEVSGGQRQRVGIARALGVRPGLVLLDEPTSALDVDTQGRMLDLLAELRRTAGTTFVLIAHDLAVVERFADRIVVLADGAVVDDFATTALHDPGRHRVTTDLIEAVLPLRRALPVADRAEEP